MIKQAVLFPMGVTLFFGLLTGSALQTSEAFDLDKLWKQFKYYGTSEKALYENDEHDGHNTSYDGTHDSFTDKDGTVWYGGGHNHAINQEFIDDYTANGLKINIDVKLGANHHANGILKAGSVEHNTLVTYPFDVQKQLDFQKGSDNLNFYYLFKPDLVQKGEHYFICVENSDSEKENCVHGINHDNKDKTEDISLSMPA